MSLRPLLSNPSHTTSRLARSRASRLGCLILCLAQLSLPVTAGIPEPDLVWYGRVVGTAGQTPVRLTAGTLVWRIEPSAGGPALVLTTVLTNINDQFSYVLRIASESPEPGREPSQGLLILNNPPISYNRQTVTLDGQPLALVNTAGEFAPGLNSRGRVERIDLQLGTLPEDSDGNGLPDAWELQYFGKIGVDPRDDADGDGMDNQAEFRAGTNPRDPDSQFAVIHIEVTAGGVVIEWSSEPGRRYQLRRASSLLEAPAAYSVIQSGIGATPPLNRFTDTTTQGGTLYFYRIQLDD
jgi:hypothetical protein